MLGSVLAASGIAQEKQYTLSLFARLSRWCTTLKKLSPYREFLEQAVMPPYQHQCCCRSERVFGPDWYAEALWHHAREADESLIADAGSLQTGECLVNNCANSRAWRLM